MGLIKTDDGKTYKLKDGSEPCMKGMLNCMFSNTTGGCSAEWCVFEELPKIQSNNKKLTCDICGNNTTTVSIYSGKTSYICDECKEKINKLTEQTNCVICGAKTEGLQTICSYCASQIREKLNESNN